MSEPLSLGSLEAGPRSILSASPLPTPSLLEADIPDELRCVSILEILSSDPRPSFIIDLEDIQINGWKPVYANSACTSSVAHLIVRDDDGVAPFRAWASDESIDRIAQFRHNGKLWSSYNLRGRWRVISGTRLYDATDGESSESSSIPEDVGSPTGSWVGASSRGSAVFSQPEEEKWIDTLAQTPFIQNKFVPNDWQNTPLGPMANWSYLLRRSVRFLLADPGAACIFWGDKHCCIFNESYAEIMGPDRRDTGQGRPSSVVWPEVYHELVPIFKELRKTRQACGWKNVCFKIIRNDILVETYWDWNLIPMMEDRGVGSGFYSSIHETTSQHMSNRRSESLLRSVHARDKVGFWKEIQDNFSRNRFDAPFAAFYDIRRPRRLSQESDGLNLPQRCVLVGGLGIPEGHDFFPDCADLMPHSDGVIPYLAEAAGGRESLILNKETHPAFFAQLNGIEWGGYEQPSHTAVIFCLRLGTDIIGFLVLGLNPCRAYNDEEHKFIDTLDNHLSASLSSAALIERFHENEQRLQQRLAQSIEQIEMSDARYRAITELSPLGMINTLPDGSTIYANRTWYEITGHPPEADYSKVDFRKIIHEDDLPLVNAEFEKMVKNKQKRYYEIRLKKKRFDSETHQWHDRWILCTGGPEYDESGEVRSVIGCLTEITAQKRAEDVQSRSRQAAEEAKAAQEKFMDATSHEMRNPLSAILQSADEITSSMKEGIPRPDNYVLLPKTAFDTCMDAAEVITLCAQHQTRIVDDVLTMSKIDSHMLEVTPIPAQPMNVVNETMQMYHGEFNSNKIESEVVIEPAWGASLVDWVFCDPARLRQILINLISNAIKFTRQEATRKITVNVTASVSKPPAVEIKGIKWFSSQSASGSHSIDMTNDPSWGDGEVVYIGVVISDTGKGLTEQERDKLFNRFAQANTLTHIHYGGSGLGLFISRELTEMHGGEIGVASKSGTGSAFAFYIKTRRVPAPRPQAPLRTNSGQLVARVAGHLVALPEGAPEPSNSLLSSPAPASSLAPPTSPTKSGLFVLVVEDNLVNQRVMTKQLVKAGCTVAIANHGQEALDYLTSTVRWSACTATPGKQIDIALVDIEMPVMNGLTCARRIREHQANGELLGHLPLMAVTANARKEQVAECLAAGMDDVTIKPFKVSDLLAKARMLVEALQQRQTDSEMGQMQAS